MGATQIKYGYEASRLVDTPEDLVEDLLCGICKRIVFHGEMCRVCDKPFCGPCISAYLENNDRMCPQGCQYETKELLPIYKKA